MAGISGNADTETAFMDFEETIGNSRTNGCAGAAANQGGILMTENQIRQKLVDKAVSFLGRKESSGGHKEIIDIYNAHKPLARGYAMKYTDAWCAAYVSAIAISTGLTDIIPTECGCGQMIELFRKLGSWRENDAYTPKPGDIIFYDWQDGGNGDNLGGADHVGIVVDIKGSTIKVIEGNINDAVGYRNIAVNGKKIRGYGVPKYSAKGTAAPAVSLNRSGTENAGSVSFAVGDTVLFSGIIHYTSSYAAASGKPCKPGKAKVTATNPTGAHPYHVVAVAGGGSTVHGWVDASVLAEGGSPVIAVGDKVRFAGGPHYKSAAASKYSSMPKAGPAKVTAIRKGAKHPYHIIHTDSTSSVYGWVDAGKVSK
ncbi:MAG: CHAP domain-containing protein [Clostridium sp.]|jgi:hypothetical protein|nr:CHAP domain-containing protein [Clostridium sp.]